MKRYFLELSYLGTGFAGFQVQENARTIQSEVEDAFRIFFRQEVKMTGSSRTDTGVHAYQNFFHFDFDGELERGVLYNLNALLPMGISLKRLVQVPSDAHCRFSAVSREYQYVIYRYKDPFLSGRGYYYPYVLDRAALQAAASLVKDHTDFAAFSKRRGQNKTTYCTLLESVWDFEDNKMTYRVIANRFLRGMVRGLVGTQLQVARGKISLNDFEGIILSGQQQEADFSVPGEGLYLCKVRFCDEVEILLNAGEKLKGA